MLSFSNISSLTNVTNNAGIITATGTIANLNAALNNLTYTSNANYTGSDVISVIVNDNNANGNIATMGNINVTIAQVIDQAPQNIVPTATQQALENTAYHFNGNISIVDTDAALATITLIAGNGVLSFSNINGLTNVINNSSSITATGTTAALNAALNSLVYNPNTNYFGTDVINLITNDNNTASINGPLTTTSTINIAVGLAVDTPSIIVPSAIAYNALDGSYVFAGSNLVQVADANGINNLQSITLTVANGKLNVVNLASSGVTLSAGANNTSTITFYGTVNEINNALNELTYSTVNSNTDLLTVVTNDVNTASGTALVSGPKITNTVSITAVTPVIGGLDAVSANTYIEGGSAVYINNHVMLTDTIFDTVAGNQV